MLRRADPAEHASVTGHRAGTGQDQDDSQGRPHSYHGSPEEAQGEGLVGRQSEGGVGLVFKRGEDSNNLVFSIVKDSPADEVGVISVGDVLVMVDTRNTEGMSLGKLRGLITGPVGSVVSLTFSRHRGSSETRYTVDLVRCADSKRSGQRTLEDLEAEVIKVREQAIEETKARAREEQLRKQVESELRKEQVRCQEIEEQVAFVLEELRRSHGDRDAAESAYESKRDAAESARIAWEEQLYQADSVRTAAEYSLRKARRESFCGFFGKR